MRNKMIFEFDSIDLNEARTFYNNIREKALELSAKYLIKRLQTRLDCNILSKEVKNNEN